MRPWAPASGEEYSELLTDLPQTWTLQRHSLLSSPRLFGNISNKHHVLYYRVTSLPHTVSNLETGTVVLTLSHKTQAFGQSLLIERTSERMMWSLQYLDTTLQILKTVSLQPDNDFRQDFSTLVYVYTNLSLTDF